MAKQVDVLETHTDYTGKIKRPLEERLKITPDFPALRLYKKIPLFVYGPYQPGGIHNYLLKDCPFLGRAHTTIPAFQMRKDAYGRCFVLKKAVHENSVYHIKGDVYVVSPETLHVLDSWLDNGEKHHRDLTRVSLEEFNLPNGKNFRGMPWIKAFIYLGVPEHWDKIETSVQMSTRIVNDPRTSYMEFQFAPINSTRRSSPHKGATDMFEDLNDNVGEKEAKVDYDERQWEEYGYPYGGVA